MPATTAPWIDNRPIRHNHHVMQQFRFSFFGFAWFFTNTGLRSISR